MSRGICALIYLTHAVLEPMKMSHEACIGTDVKITRQMELAGVSALESLTGILDDYSLVKAVYIAMARSSLLAPSQGLLPDRKTAR